MITEVLLLLPLYVILFVMWWQFQHLTKMSTGVENGNEFFCRYYWYIKIGCWAALGAISKGKILGGQK